MGSTRRPFVAAAACALALTACAAFALPAEAASVPRAWSAGQTVTTDGIQPLRFDGGVTGDGDVVAVWNKERTSWPPAVLAAIKPHGGSFGTVQNLGFGGPGVDVAVERGGDAVAAWYDSSSSSVMVSRRAPGSDFGAGIPIGSGGQDPQVAINGRGDAVVAWMVGETDGSRMYASVRPAGGDWSAPEDVSGLIPSTGGAVPTTPPVALTSSGEALFVWADPGSQTVRTSSRPLAGSVTAPDDLSDTSVRAWGPSIVADAHGHAIATWTERPAGGTGSNDHAKAAIRDALGTFGPTHDSGSPVYPNQLVRVAAGPNGHALVSWMSGTSSPDGTRSQSGAVYVVDADLAAGTFGSQSTPMPESMRNDLWSVAIDGGGEALFAYSDWGSLETHALRRPAGGEFAPVQTLECPYRSATVMAAGIDDAGVGSVLWAPYYSGDESDRALRLSQDHPSKRFGRPRCDSQAPIYTISPYLIGEGMLFTIDGSGGAGPDGTTDSWSWDFDNDGTFEIDTGANPQVTHSFPTHGTYRVQMKVTSTGSGGAVSVATYPIDVLVLVQNTTGPGAGGGAPPASAPDETTPPPDNGGLPDGNAEGPPAPVVTVTPERHESLQRVLRRGLLVHLRSKTTQRVKVVLKRGTGTVGARLVTLRPNRSTTLRIRIERGAARKLRRMRTLKLTVQARVGARVAGARSVTLARTH